MNDHTDLRRLTLRSPSGKTRTVLLEDWRDIPGYEGLYRVSDRGRVLSLARAVNRSDGRTRQAPTRILKPFTSRRGYPGVNLRKNAKGRTVLVHTLVVAGFRGPCPPGMETLHFDDDSSNPALYNLRYGTRSENVRDARRSETLSGAADSQTRPPRTKTPLQQQVSAVTMIVLDPCKGAVPRDFQGNDDVAVRQYLEPIAELCARCHVTLIGLVHFGKRESRDPGKLILGSVAWSQVARSVISIAEDPDSGNRVLTNTKANYSPRSRSIEFRIVSKIVETDDGPSVLGAVEWIGDTDKDARNLLGELGRTDDDELDERDYTDDFRSSWLYRYLKDAHAAGEDVRPKDAVAVGADKGASRRSVFRLFDKLANAGMAESVEGTEFPRVTHWRFIPETTGARDPHVRDAGTTGTSAADQGKEGGTTGSLFDAVALQGDTTAETAVDQGRSAHHSTVKPFVVPVVSPIHNDTPHRPPGGITATTPGMSDRVAAALAKAGQQTVPADDGRVSHSLGTLAPRSSST